MQADATNRISNSPAAALKPAFAGIVGADNVRDDEASLRLHSEDVWATSEPVAMLIVAPTSIERLSGVIAEAHIAGLAIAPRGRRIPFWGPMSGIYSTIGGGLGFPL